MGRIGRPKGLIDYKSLDELNTGHRRSHFKTPMVIVSAAIIVLSALIIAFGVVNISDLKMSVYHQRQPAFIKLSSGEIRNRYQIKVLNKTGHTALYRLTVQGFSGINKPDLTIPPLEAGKSIVQTVVLDVSPSFLSSEVSPIYFHLEDESGVRVKFSSVFLGPSLSGKG